MGRALSGCTRTLVLVACALVIGACSTGSDEASLTGPSASTLSESSETAVAGAAAKESSFEPDGEFALATLKAVNEARSIERVCGAVAYPAVAPIRWNLKATEAARIESQWMQTFNSWGHVWPDGTNVGSRLDMAGYEWETAGENIAAGFVSLEAVMQAWLDSPGHCANIMRADVDEVGVSLIWGEDANTYRSYWTMVLAKSSAVTDAASLR